MPSRIVNKIETASAKREPPASSQSEANDSIWRRRFGILSVAGVLFFVASSFSTVRRWIVLPLYVHDPDAQGEVAYVMADGPAVWERLHAASDLYHMERVKRIYLLREENRSRYNFVRHQSDTRLQREIDFLESLGVPSDQIHSVAVIPNDWLSSRSEAVGLANELDLTNEPGDAQRDRIGRIVVVTSAPHTRRSRLCFRRTFAESTIIDVFSASSPGTGAEIHSPIWIEYIKLAVYWVCV